MQKAAYNDALEKYKEETRWLAIIDLDEYICPSDKVSLPEFLKDYEAYPALVVNWQLFDSNNHKTKPNSSILESYTRVHKLCNRFRDNWNIKSIIDPMRTERCVIHHCKFTEGHAVCENYTKLKTALTATQRIEKIRINHYFTKSEEEFLAKVNRGNACGAPNRKFEQFVHHNFPDSYMHDYTILQHINKK